MNVTISGHRYLVREPDGTRHYVSKEKRCTCLRVKCLHIKAVSLYLEMGGKRAPEPIQELTLAERAARIMESRVVSAVDDSRQVSYNTNILLDAIHIGDTNTERIETWKRHRLYYEGDGNTYKMLLEGLPINSLERYWREYERVKDV